MGDDGHGFLGVLAAIVVFGCGIWVIGASLRVVLGVLGVKQRGVGVTLAQGMALAGLVGALAFKVLGSPVEAFWLLFGSSVVVLIAAAISGLLGRPSAVRPVLRSLCPTRFDLAAAAVTMVVLAPLIAHGPVFWTSGPNDYPSYAASVDVWTMGGSDADSDFSQRHPDGFGRLQAGRGEYEKPMVTGVLLAAAELTSTDAYRLLTPLIVVTFCAGLACWMEFLRRAFKRSFVETVAAAVLPAISIVPFSRLLDAQPGHVAVIALVGALVYVLHDLFEARGRRAAGAAATSAALLAAAGLGSNATLVVGSGIIFVAVGVVVAGEAAATWRSALKRVAVALLGVIVLSVALIPNYRWSIKGQTDGLAGYDLPLPGPLALLGLQERLTSVPSTLQVMVAWATVLGAAFALRSVLPPQRLSSGARAPRPILLLLVASVINAGIVMREVGPTNYSSHKLVAVFVAVAGPVLLISLFAFWPRRARIAGAGLLVCITATAATFAYRAASDVPVQASDQLMDLALDPRLDALDVLNIDLGDQFQNSIAALVAGADRVVVTGQNYGGPSAPEGSHFLLRDDSAVLEAALVTHVLKPPYVLAELDFSPAPSEVVPIGSGSPQNARFIVGPLHVPETGGVWSRRESFQLLFDVPAELRGRDVLVTIVGARYAKGGAERTVSIALDGTVLAEEVFDSPVGRPIEIRIPAELVAASQSRLILDISTPDLLSPSAFGSDDTRLLGFHVQSFSLAAADA